MLSSAHLSSTRAIAGASSQLGCYYGAGMDGIGAWAPAEIPLSNCLCIPSQKCWVETRNSGQGCLAHPCNSSWALCLQGFSLVLLTLCFFRPLATLAGSACVSQSPVLCRGLRAREQWEGCQSCCAVSGLQPLLDSRGLGVGKLGSKRGFRVTASFIRRGEKTPFLLDCWQNVGP